MGSVRDYYEFSENIYDYILLVQNCKVAMFQRQDINKIYMNAQMKLEDKKKRLEKLKADPKASLIKEKIDAAENEVQEQQQKCAAAKKDVIKISKLLRKELERFDFVKIQDFQNYCVNYIESVMTM